MRKYSLVINGSIGKNNFYNTESYMKPIIKLGKEIEDLNIKNIFLDDDMITIMIMAISINNLYVDIIEH